jgi:23S rRNA pseudouridine2605 synthase
MLERLQKIIAHAGIASRRHAEQLILSGQVLVNGVVVRELGSKADPAVDKIEAAGRLVEEKRAPVYLVMHKPPEVVSTLVDPEGRKTLRNFLRGFPERVYPVGNLDYSASGLIFMTNDGSLTDTMLKSWSNIPQVYHIKIKGRLDLDQLDALGQKTNTVVRVIRQPDSTRGHAQNFWYEAQVTGSKLDTLSVALMKDNHPLEKVKRIGLGPLSLEGIPAGHYVILNKEQAEALRHPTRPMRFTPHPRAKTFVKPAAKPANRPVSSQPHRPPNPFGKAQRFSKPSFAKTHDRPAHYGKFQRRPSTPSKVPENFDDFDDERLENREAPRAPWLSTSRRPANPSPAFRPGSKPGRDSQSFRPKGPRKFASSSKGSSGKPHRPGGSSFSNKFDRLSHASGKPPRHSSTRPKSHRSFPPRKPRPPR